jgi:hypothetical protein
MDTIISFNGSMYLIAMNMLLSIYIRPFLSFTRKFLPKLIHEIGPSSESTSSSRWSSSRCPSASRSACSTFISGVHQLHAYIGRVARWFLFRPKILICVCFGGPWNGKCCYTYILVILNILPPLGIFNGHLVIFVVILYIFPRFGIGIVQRKIWQTC